jgi:oxygen-independent coproporphyrinogen-3 oxidase
MAIRQRAEKKPLGIYIHVPFCRSKCVYCDFYSVTNKDDKLLDAYLNAICTHIKETGPLAPNYHVDTIYFGGGTPSFFGADGMIAILTAIRKSFHVDLRAEITFEANPDSISPRLLRRLKSEGFNRVSLGVQCDNDEILKKLGRPHNFEQVVNAVKRIRRAGYKNLSLDLIYGLPGQTLESWEKTLENVIALKPEHMSCYGLKVEEGTPLYQYQEYMDLPDDDTQADMYLSAVNILRRNGFRQYEISNFAQRGYPSAHNLKYWMGGEYLGFGPDASSDFAGKRFSVVRDLQSYIDGILHGGQVLRDVQEIPQRERAGEYLMTRLRTTTGIYKEEYENSFLLPFEPLEDVLRSASERRHAYTDGKGRWRLTPEGFLVSNSIISDLLLVQDRSKPLGKRV